MNYGWEVLDKSICHDGFFRLERYRLRHELFAGGWSGELVRELLERGHAVAVLLYDPIRDQVVLVEQFRIGALASGEHPWMLEVVAGIIETNEDPHEVARRESREEAGCMVTELIPINRFIPSSGGCSEHIVLYCGRVDASKADGIHGLAHEGEDIRVRVIPASEALAMLEQGTVLSAMTLIALQWLALNRGRLRERWQ